MPADKRISSDHSAKRVAEEMARLWKDAKRKGVTNRADLRAAAWKHWRGCNELKKGKCETIFGVLYVPARSGKGDSLNISLVDKPTRLGGAVWKTCNWQGQNGTFPCLVVDPSRVEGKAGGWSSKDDKGSYDRDGNPKPPSPLTAIMVVVPTDTLEYRFWLSEHTGYPVDIQAFRSLTQRGSKPITWKMERGICIEGKCRPTMPKPSRPAPTTPGPNQPGRPRLPAPM